jgi:L-ascorbate metabolism protein UlaG (beta-lactamase superfamily)
MKIKRKKFLYMILLSIVALATATFGILRLPQFGRKATGLRRNRILNSPNFKDGKFQNISFTPDLNPDYNYWDLLMEYFRKHENKAPNITIPSVKTDLHKIDANKNSIVWFGHSSYLLHFEGKRILVDPVFSGFAAPFSFMIPAYKGANVYLPADFPEIDILIITHDHYDHLDYQTVTKLKPKINQIITSLGVGEHLEQWGFNPKIITELDWNEQHQLPDLQVISATTRHFSGRSLSPKTTLWGSFILKGKNSNVYVGGDSGYDIHFKKIGDEHGPFDLVILDGGQYNERWKDIHMNPEQTAQAALDLKAKKLFPVHWAKFTMAFHAWNDPVIRVTQACENLNMPYFTTKIGEVNDWEEKVGGEKWWA